MTKIIKSDLLGSNINNMITSLESDIKDCDNIITALNNFILETKNDLTGSSFDAARTKISSYIPILTKRKELASRLSFSLSFSISVMNNYVEEYDELDDSKCQDIASRLNQISNDLNSVYNKLKEEMDTTSSTYIECFKSIARYQTMHKELTRLNEKLMNLASTDESAYSKISNLSNVLSSYKSEVDSITVTNF